MTIAIPSKDEKAHAALQAFFEVFLYPRLTEAERLGVQAHLEWIKTQPHSFANVRFETIPQLHLTRLTLEISHTQIAPFKPN